MPWWALHCAPQWASVIRRLSLMRKNSLNKTVYQGKDGGILRKRNREQTALHTEFCIVGIRICAEKICKSSSKLFLFFRHEYLNTLLVSAKMQNFTFTDSGTLFTKCPSVFWSAPYLSVAKLQINSLTTVLYERQKLCRAVGLTVRQLPLLACLLGNDVVSQQEMQHIRNNALAAYRCLVSYHFILFIQIRLIWDQM